MTSSMGSISSEYSSRDEYSQQKSKLVSKIIGDHDNNAIGIDPTASSSNIIYCHSCKSDSVVSDYLTGETICSNCAEVISDRQMVMEINPNQKNGMGNPTSLVFPDRGLSTVITTLNTDAYGTSLSQDQISNINKIRYYDKISTNRSHIRNLRNAFVIMASIKDKLTLPDSIIERAAYYYRKTLDNKLTKGRSIKEMVVASVYASCKEMNIPRRLDEISDAVNADRIFAGRCYRIMIRELDFDSSIVDATQYIAKIAENAEVSQKTYRIALDILDEVKKNPISYGKDPKALATAALYGGCMIEEQGRVSQTRIAKAGGISVVTLRKRILDISRVFPRLQMLK
ncbi:MAG TPA: TFIIB-type zinc ribbon-containing protein [Nitrososphaeraceae archaeon]|nr:TFIIB-type zinc ribbon-containing protein [Nitrososphaeraceae archaeon]